MEKKNTFIRNLVGRMSLNQKIGAVLTLGFAGTVPRPHIYRYIEKYHCGGLRLSCDMRQFGSYVDPNGNKTVVKLENADGIRFKGPAPVPTVSQYKEVLDDLQACARRRPCSIPLHFSYDQEGGSSADFFFGGVNLFPKPMGIRAMDDPEMAYRIARAVAAQGKAVGFNWVHSPVLDVNSHPDNPEIYTRAYSDDAAEVTEYARQTCRGLKDGWMIATGKHFPGRGHSDVDAHFRVPVIDVDEETLWERELLPYRELIGEGILPSIMIAHSIFPAVDPDNIATVSKKVITGLLREKLGFEGVITTDSMTMGAIATRYGVANACALSLEAGADLVLMKAENQLVEEVVEAIRSFIQEGRISMEEMDDKVYRILQLKYEYGLFGPAEDSGATACPEQVIQQGGIRKLARQAARRSILVERDRENCIPIQGKRILIIEQKVKEYNDIQWHSGILYEACLRHEENVEYMETSYSYDDTDREKIAKILAEGMFDTVIATNYFLRGKAHNTRFWEKQLEEHSDAKVVFVSNTPYESLSIPRNAGSVLVTFATSPENIKAAAAVLFGDMVPEGVWPLKNRKPGSERKKYLVCIDSDGCAMDTMTVKHTKCFGPCLVKTWGLQEEEKILQRWNEINLYTRTRGINRFKGLVKMLGELQESGNRIEGLEELEEWVNTSPELSNAALKERLEKGAASPALRKALEWSLMVNEAIEGLGEEEKQPFAGVTEAMTSIREHADIAIVSSANREAVEEEWTENGLMDRVDYVFAQDQGSKEVCLNRLLGLGYEPGKVLMIGDAPGDLGAAQGAGVAFYPIVPGKEAASWEVLRKEGFPCFMAEKDWQDYAKKKEEAYLDTLDGKKSNYALRLADTIVKRYPKAVQYPYRDWCYPQGYLLIGFTRLWEATGDVRYRDYIYEYCDSHVSPEGDVVGFKGSSMDDMMAGSILVWMYEQTGEERYKTACRHIYEAFQDYPRTREGGFLHGRNGVPGQMWVDGVFMGQMFYCRYGRTFHEPSCFDEAKRQLELIYQYCYAHDGMLVHAYSEDNLASWAGEHGKSSCIWSEGLGWYALILCEVLDLAPQEHPVYAMAKKMLLELLEGLLQVQDASSGLWYQVVDRPGDTDNWCDVSGSAMFTYAFYHALQTGLISGAAYEQAAERGYEGVQGRMTENEEGLLDVHGACDGLCVQESYDVYVHYPQQVNSKEAVCGCLWAAIAAEM